jgi:predicted permease
MGAMINSADLRYAVRLLRKSPWFTLLTVVVLAGGLGISVYTFAALNTMFYRGLPLTDGDAIVRVGAGEWPAIQPLDAYEIAAIRSQSATLREVGGYRQSWALVGEGAGRRSVRAVESEWRIFEFSRMPPLLGRSFTQGDSVSGEPVAVLGYATWQTVFSGDADAVGKLVRINGRLTRIVGVMPEGYAFPVNTAIWLPLEAAELDPPTYSDKALNAYARLRPGSTVQVAKTELATLLQRLPLERRDTEDHKTKPVSVLSFPDASWGAFGTLVFGVLNLLSLSILLLAAVNIGNLLLARTNTRIAEIGVRLALGAPRVRLIVQVTMENLVLCVSGGALAAFLAARALAATDSFMRALLADNLPFWLTWGLDGEAVVVAGLLLLLTVLAVSVLPALSVSRVDPNALLKDSARGSAGLATGRISRALVTVQVALISAVMLVGSTVTLIAQRAANINVGMSTTNLHVLGVTLPVERYTSPDKQLSAYERLLSELRAIAAVDAAVVMQDRPDARVAVVGTEYASPADRPASWIVTLSESPRAIGPTLVEGRTFDSRDTPTSSKTTLVSRTFAQSHWPDESPLGRQIDIYVGGAEPERRTVVGVLSDVSYDPVGGTSSAVAAVYVPLPQHVSPASRILVRYFGDEAAARNAIYEAIERVDPQIAPTLMTYESLLDQVTLFARTVTTLFAGAGAFAILIAITGIYAMGSNAVVLRTQEIGLRRALGASHWNVIAIFVAQGARQLITGLAFGAALSVAALIVIEQAFSVGIGAVALIGVGDVAVISTTVLLSIYVSVRGAVHLEPSASLRHG